MAEIRQDSVGIVQTKKIRVVEQNQPLQLECGKKLGPVDVAYETYGQLNESGDNVVLICHALSGNAHVAGKNSPFGRGECFPTTCTLESLGSNLRTTKFAYV